ncbi:MAG TPA: metallophosphoesterase [Kiloniellales bacterium]|nr:metallophosphoesterase [Kiloniellales bacterium]
MSKLFAISDLHAAVESNREAIAELGEHPDDWLIVAGDVAEKPDQLWDVLELLKDRFAEVIWTPGNHELWTVREGDTSIAGQAKYELMVEVARSAGAVTPEDPFPRWRGPTGDCIIAPLFLLYDYSFRPDHVSEEAVVAWAAEERAVCSDEVMLSPAPYPSRQAWCADRLQLTRARLEKEVPDELPTILVNHYPLREEFVYLPRIPRFTPWCGTRATADWHRRYRALACISGHLHIRRTDWRDGTRFEEVSLGYPKQWRQEEGLKPYLREILPGPAAASEEPGTIFHGP